MTLDWIRSGVIAIGISAAIGVVYWGAAETPLPSNGCEKWAVLQFCLDGDEGAGNEIERRVQMSMQRSNAKRAAIEELLTGRLTLLQAAAQFRDIDIAFVALRTRMNPDDSTLSEGEHYCGLVIRWEQVWLFNHMPEVAAEVAARREGEINDSGSPTATYDYPNRPRKNEK